MSFRNDVHRPSEIIPSDYEFVAFEYLKNDDGFADTIGAILVNRALIQEHMKKTGATYSRHAHGGNCHICGAHAIYTALFFHPKSNTYIRTGLDCADKLECGDAEDFRSGVQRGLEAKAGKNKAQKFLELRGMEKAWEIYLNPKETDKYEEITIRDMVGNLVKYGSFSDKQTNYLGILLDKISKRAIIEAERKAAHDAAAEIPKSETRMTVTGTILAIKTKDKYGNPYFQNKILVQHESGYKLWGSQSINMIIAVGDKIQFDAKVKVSDNDPKFGFFSRPTKCKRIV